MNNSYTIAEEFHLPSRGKVYSQNVNPIVKLRSMTTEDEMKRLSPSERSYKNICEIIDDCLVENPGISSYDMCLADYQYLLYMLRVVTYGSKYNVTSRCPYCASDNDSSIDLTKLKVTPYTKKDIDKFTNITLPMTKHKLTIRMQTPRMIDDVDEQVKEHRKLTKNKQGDSAFLFTLMSIIDTIDGEEYDPIKKEDFVRKLPMADTNFVFKNAEKIVESFGVQRTTDNVCPICGLDYTSSFRITKEFFGPSIDL